jgi:uncharacterized membrane protein YoaK (UPF0700 family)
MNSGAEQRAMTVMAIALTFGSGVADVASYTRLGGVFTSVMTGNIVLWGLAAARGSLTLFSHTAVSISAYIVGVAAGARIAHRVKTAAGNEAPLLESHVSWVLRSELILLAGFTAGWEISAASPTGWAQFCLLAVLAAAMGMQSSAVRDMGMSEVSTTFLTGTLTGLVASAVRPGQTTPHRLRKSGVLIGLAAGAGLCGLLVATAPAAVPALLLAALVTTVVVAANPDRLAPRASQPPRASAPAPEQASASAQAPAPAPASAPEPVTGSREHGSQGRANRDGSDQDRGS